jgi:hypothetical protein
MPRNAGAFDIFFNNVKVDTVALRNYSLKDCEVSFDKDGNIYINAPQYKMMMMNTQSEVKEPKPTKHYYLVTQAAKPGSVKYYIEIFINGYFVKGVSDQQGDNVFEITEYFKKGLNKVEIKARKVITSYPDGNMSDYFRVIIGEGSGDVKDNRIVVETNLISYVRYANESESFSDAQYIDAK